MSDADKLRTAELSIKNLESRLVTVEEQLATCLRWMRKQAELEAQKKDPEFKPREIAKA
jgi:hypothetical protein